MPLPPKATFAAILAVTAMTACAKNPSTTSAATSGAPAKVSVVATKVGCAPSPARIESGPVTFAVSNSNAPAVTEIELQKGSRILAEKENLIPGLSGSFSLRLEPGSYTVYCPGAGTDKTAFVVTAAS